MKGGRCPQTTPPCSPAFAWQSSKRSVIIHDQLALEYGHSSRSMRRRPHTFAQVFAKPLPFPDLPAADRVRQWLGADPAEPGMSISSLPIEIHIEPLNALGRQARLPQSEL
jgi:hypothetical protein